ncbi:kinase-like domain-containing protein [Mycena floridula]|nr:kinase-like domain-containing protein [Mycena floridula]
MATGTLSTLQILIQEPEPKITGQHPELVLEDSEDLSVDMLPFSQASYTSVHRAQQKNNNLVALKSWRSTGMSYSNRVKFYGRLEKEFKTWKSLCHPNIAPIFGTVDLEAFSGLPSLLMPFYHRGNINQHIRNTPSVDILYLLEGVACGLTYMHQKDLSHGNVRGCNILIADNGEAVLTDIGTSHLPQPPDWTISSGDSTRWMAPEVMSPEPDLSSSECDADTPFTTLKGDVYSFGMTVFEIYTKKQPFAHRKFYGPVVYEVMQGIRPPRPSNCPQLTDDIWRLIQSCWEQDPQNRPTIEMVRAWIRVLSQMNSLRQ